MWEVLTLGMKLKSKVHTKLTEKKGEWTDTGLKIVIGVFFAALVIGAVYGLYELIVIPGMNSQASSMFTYSGN
jgi:hypothetical protein